MKYICPICGKSYSKPADLAACVQKCANEADNKEQRAIALYEEINKEYTRLKGMISEYNALGTGKIFTSTLSHTADKPVGKPTFTFKSYRPDWSVLDSWNIGGNDKTEQVKFSNKLDTDSEFEKFLKDSLKIKEPESKATDSIDDEDVAEILANLFMGILGGSDEIKKSL